jgi:hypothetical protein
MNRRALFSLPLLALAQPVLAADLSEGDRLLIETTQILGSVAGSTDRFSVVQQYMAQRQLVTTYLEGQYQGMTVDWAQIPAVLKAK